MARKSSVYITDRAERVIGELPEGDSLSGRINAIADRYGEIIDRARRQVLRDLTENELLAVRTVSASWATRHEPAGVLLGGLAAEVEDACIAGGDLHDQGWTGTDAQAIVAKLQAMTPAEQLALIEWLERG